MIRTQQPMQGDLRQAVDPHGHNRGSNTGRRVSGHIMIFPRARSEAARQNRTEREGDRARQTNLPAMGVAAQQQIETGMGRLPINFWRVRQQN